MARSSHRGPSCHPPIASREGMAPILPKEAPMRKKALMLFGVLVLLAVTAVPAFAITGNWVEDNDHPFVGLVVFYDANGEFMWRCSGSLQIGRAHVSTPV